MARILVTGGTGFLGSHMSHYLAGEGHDVVATYLDPPEASVRTRLGTASTVHLDVRDIAAVRRVLEETRPDVVYHFAGQAYVVPSTKDPIGTFQVNLLGTLHFLETLARTRPRTAFAFAGSGTEYGAPDRVPTPEDAELRPTSPYASSKTAADLLCYQYFASDQLPVFRYRIFGTTGVGKTGDVCNDFASQIARIERGEISGPMRVGTLDVRRDIADVRDAVRAMVRVVERGTPGTAYNIGSGEATPVRAILQTLRSLAHGPVDVEVDPTRFRQVDEPVHLGEISRLKALGWTPEHPMESSLRDILDFWRSRTSPP
ncbi:MAG: GDP-mannose 4,6-dehydratase [Thermoplasmata archaeon]|jgi:GDP-4-dehydro-6-deoxy-D-mannose reductase